MPGGWGVTARACCSMLWRMSLSHSERGKERVLHTSFRVGYCPTGSPISEMLLVSQPHALPGPCTVPGHAEHRSAPEIPCHMPGSRGLSAHRCLSPFSSSTFLVKRPG